MTQLAIRQDFSDEQIDLIRRTLCQGATADELALFLGQCRRTGLDPFSRQIHAVKRWDKRAGREVMSIQVGIDGLRLIAERTGQTDGQDGPYWCGQDGRWCDVWLKKEPPAAARVIVFRMGQSRGYVGIATATEYAQWTKDGKPSGLWGKMPALMLAKCAESLALRKAFPHELSGLYTPEEMSQADAIPAAVESQPEPRPAITQGNAQPIEAVISADVLFALCQDVAELEGADVDDVIQRLLAALKSEAASLDDLSPTELRAAIKAARKKVADLRAAGTLPGAAATASNEPTDISALAH